MYVSWLDKGEIRQVLRNWPLAQESRICVVTDGSRILGTATAILVMLGTSLNIIHIQVWVISASVEV